MRFTEIRPSKTLGEFNQTPLWPLSRRKLNERTIANALIECSRQDKSLVSSRGQRRGNRTFSIFAPPGQFAIPRSLDLAGLGGSRELNFESYNVPDHGIEDELFGSLAWEIKSISERNGGEGDQDDTFRAIQWLCCVRKANNRWLVDGKYKISSASNLSIRPIDQAHGASMCLGDLLRQH
jgi:hypothetical protein